MTRDLVKPFGQHKMTFSVFNGKKKYNTAPVALFVHWDLEIKNKTKNRPLSLSHLTHKMSNNADLLKPTSKIALAVTHKYIQTCNFNTRQKTHICTFCKYCSVLGFLSAKLPTMQARNEMQNKQISCIRESKENT